jgi:hypothetical protein
MSTAVTSIKKLPINITARVLHLLLLCDNTILLGSHTAAFFMIRFHFIHHCFRSFWFQTFCGKGPHPLFWAVSRAARGKIKSVICKPLKYCVVFILHT